MTRQDQISQPGNGFHRCLDCNGWGVVSDYGCGEDFYGPKDCPTCKGSGRVPPRDKSGRFVKRPNLLLTAMALCLMLACVIAIWTVIAASAVPAKADRLKWQPWSSEGRTVNV
jgi:hypothetical protein